MQWQQHMQKQQRENAAAVTKGSLQGQQQHANTAAPTVAKAPAKACSSQLWAVLSCPQLFLVCPQLFLPCQRYDMHLQSVVVY